MPLLPSNFCLACSSSDTPTLLTRSCRSTSPDPAEAPTSSIVDATHTKQFLSRLLAFALLTLGSEIAFEQKGDLKVYTLMGSEIAFEQKGDLKVYTLMTQN
jgi:hypothetical protein